MNEEDNLLLAFFIVDMGEIYCNEMRYIVETFLEHKPEIKKEVERLKNCNL